MIVIGQRCRHPAFERWVPFGLKQSMAHRHRGCSNDRAGLPTPIRPSRPSKENSMPMAEAHRRGTPGESLERLRSRTVRSPPADVGDGMNAPNSPYHDEPPAQCGDPRYRAATASGARRCDMAGIRLPAGRWHGTPAGGRVQRRRKALARGWLSSLVCPQCSRIDGDSRGRPPGQSRAGIALLAWSQRHAWQAARGRRLCSFLCHGVQVCLRSPR